MVQPVKGRLQCRTGPDPWVGKIPGEREWNPSPVTHRLENPMDNGDWQAMVHEVSRVRCDWSDVTFTFHFQSRCRYVKNCLSNLCGDQKCMFDQNAGPTTPIGSVRVGLVCWMRGGLSGAKLIGGCRLWMDGASPERTPGDRDFHGQSSRLKRALSHHFWQPFPSLFPF